jgi:hypothetical protein
MKVSKSIVIFLLIGASLLPSGCATTAGKVAIGMIVGGLVGAVVGEEFVHHGPHNEYATQNTIITSAVFALGTGGVLAWHYQALDEKTEEISGRYARYRLCNPDDMKPGVVAGELDLSNSGNGEKSSIYQIQDNQIGKTAISLDDNTKWVYPVFRKRYLLPELGESQVVSERYIWEILKPGSFVTRAQNPNYFFETEKKP